MKHLVMIILVGILLVGCETVPPREISRTQSSATSGSSSSVVASSVGRWEEIPSELSIPHFSRMQLSGTGLTLVKILRREPSYVQHEIRYLSNGLTISGILNIPTGDGPFPLLIFNHGHISPSIYTVGRGLRREQDYMARRGFAVLHTDYRGHGESDPSPMVEKTYDGNLEYAMDSVNAILAVRAANLPQIDAQRVGMLGHSMGGGVTLAILTARPDLVDAVLYAPVHANVWENFSRWRREREKDDRTEEISGTPETQPDHWEKLSPQTYLSNITAPVMIFHGDRDKDVPKEWSDDLHRRLMELGKDVTYVEYAGEGHEFGPEWGDFMKKSAEFFRKNLSH
jgi:dipeptidyl aminopeptidase/acylaminoacyl peptidase